MFPNETKILIVDDMTTMRKIVRKTLSTMGFKDVTEADDGNTAWPKIEDAAGSGAPFELIISDWNMPEISGLDLLKKVRDSASVQKTPFILLTAESEKDNIIQAIQAGVDNYVIKPFTPAGLSEKIKQVWQKTKDRISS